jgi:type IV secretory pathway VirB6-like protein
MDYTSMIFDGINKVLSQHGSFFEATGREVFRWLAVTVVSWFGIRAALSGAQGGAGFNWSDFSALLIDLSFVYSMLTFYTVPIPGLGVSFTHLILDQVTALVQQLNQARVQEVLESLNNLESNLPFPTALEILTIIRVIILVLCIAVAQAVTLAVIMFGYVATAVLLLLGPVFIPFKIVPSMDWLFWGWLRAFMQYAFYQLIASVYVFIFGDMLMQVLGAKAAPMTAEEIGYLFAPLVLTLITFVLGIVKVPALTFSLFSGRSGDYVFLWWK